jgi:hypothetical protein
LDGKVLKGRTLRVRSAPHSAAVRVKNLSPFVTNELLEKAFSIFGDVIYYLLTPKFKFALKHFIVVPK